MEGGWGARASVDMEYGLSGRSSDQCFVPAGLSPSFSFPSASSSEVCTLVHSERAPASTSDSSFSSPWEVAASQMMETDMAGVVCGACPSCDGTGRSKSTGSLILDRARMTSVEYWQKIAKDLSVENEELRKQLGSFQQPKGVAVQEVLTQLFVEKVKDVSPLESIIDTPTHAEAVKLPGFAKSSIKKNLSRTSFAQMDVSEGLDKDLVMELSEMEYSEHFRGLDRLDAVEVLERTNNIELLLQMVLKDVPVIISHCDKDLCYTYVKFVDHPLTKVSPEDMKGKKDTELVGLVPGALETMRIKKEVLELGIAIGKEVTVTMDGFGKRWLVVACEPLRNKAGQILGVITACMDVTEQALARERLAQMREEMAVREATEKELRRAIRLADEAMEAKNNFLAVMSHEIRTPLNGVLGMAQVLATTPLDPEQRELVSAMVFSADVLLAIISDVLDLSKVEAGTLKLEEKELNPRDIVKHVVRTAIAASKDRGITIHADIGDDVPSVVYGDPLRIKQVITNLVFNAVKFTRKGHVKVRLHVAKFSMEARKTDLKHSVSDSLTRASKLESTEDAVHMTDRKTEGNEILMGRSSLLKLRQLGGGESWDPLMEGGRRDLPELSVTEDEMGDTIRGPITGTAHSKRLMKMHSAGFTFQDVHEAVTGLSGGDQKASTGGDQAQRDFWLKFEIEDTGIGIPKDALPTLFEKFTLVHSSTTRKYGGTGLGLAICKQLVELMDGHISVVSTEGKGSTFTFTLRCKRPPAATGSPGSAKLVSETKMKENLSHSTANVHKLQAGMCSSLKSETILSNLQTYQVLDDDRGPRRSVLVDATSYRVPTKLPRGSLKGAWTESRDRGGVNRGGLRRTSSGPSRINTLMMADLDHSKSVPAISAPGPVVDKKLPSLLLAEDNKVLMDICMPVLDGLEVTRRIRRYEDLGYWDEESTLTPSDRKPGSPGALEDLPLKVIHKQSASSPVIGLDKVKRMPIIAMTANALSDCERQCSATGMDSFMTKPVTFKKLKDVLALHLPHKSSMPSP
ncbi:hypothetical protein KC19_2G028100 [Ceratodon purpureus]|uniref:histidine kinase n=1 Tax=Ceratodon purpureus TaxID=3225 RepID=A0A8T0IRH2_CERPU|nr:hypothetical protein KC19_2G028100 [Ceratodon purpureus]KAG0585659.1 hypothetical protein KC19_2G028100 [Ceratodon purpureus]